jgi:hypothetical protein
MFNPRVSFHDCVLGFHATVCSNLATLRKQPIQMARVAPVLPGSRA